MDESRIEHLAALERIRTGAVSYEDARIFCRGCASHQQCRLGIDIRRDLAEGVVGTVSLPEWCEGGGGAAHGGFVMAVLDEVASAVHTSAGRLGITTRFDVEFRRPVPVGRTLNVRAHSAAGAEDGSVVEVQISDVGVLAEGRASFVVRDPLRHYRSAREREGSGDSRPVEPADADSVVHDNDSPGSIDATTGTDHGH